MPKKTHIPHVSPKNTPQPTLLDSSNKFKSLLKKILRNNKNVVYPKKQMHITISKNKANNLRKKGRQLKFLQSNP